MSTPPQSQTPETEAKRNLLEAQTTMKTDEEYAALEAKLNEAVTALQIDQWIKGQWKCHQCNFVLSKNVLSVRDGNIYANAEPFNEVCPNDGQAMKPLTYKESYEDICKCCEQQVERAVKAEQQNQSLIAQIAMKDEALKFYGEYQPHEARVMDGGLKARTALTNSPAAAQELLKKLEDTVTIANDTFKTLEIRRKEAQELLERCERMEKACKQFKELGNNLQNIKESPDLFLKLYLSALSKLDEKPV